MINITDKHNCCGCEACVQACPKQCISFNEDTEGFRYPKVDMSLCVECGACERKCPVMSPFESRLPKLQVAAINSDEAIRAQSSSGGIFTMLAEKVIREGGVVFGVRFDEHWQAVFDHTDSIEGLASFRGSKYIQARVGNVFTEVRTYLRNGRKVMFTGTSCQVAALRHFLHHDYDNLLLVDVVCHGVPSPKVWRRYLDEVTKNAVRAISDIQFRNNKQGWKRFNFDLTCDSEGHNLNISSYHQKNHFMRIFLNDVILRPSCHQCKAKGGRSGSDLTIADFWGIGQLNPDMDDDLGTSLVLVYTDKGAAHLLALHVNVWQAQYEDVLHFNSAIEQSKHEHPKREWFFDHLDTTDSVISLINSTLRPPFFTRIKNASKKLIGKVCRALINGGGNFGREEQIIVAYQESDPIFMQPTGVRCPIIKAITFRSKQSGWNRYRMKIRIEK